MICKDIEKACLNLYVFNLSPSFNLHNQPRVEINSVVGDRDSFTFEVSVTESILIQVKRVNTDLKRVLTGAQNNLIYAVSFPALARGKYPLALNYQQQALQYLNDFDDEYLKGELYSQAAIIYFYNGQIETGCQPV